MKYRRVALGAIGYELAPVVVGTDELEARLAPLYDQLRIPVGQLEALTGIVERRWWPAKFDLATASITSANRALATAGVDAADLDAVIYAGVCRQNFEPATACRVAAAIGAPGTAWVYDVSNACLGMLNAVCDVANRIELGHMRRALIVACESAREIVDVMIERMLDAGTFECYRTGIATLTGGSGAAAIVLQEATEAPGCPLLQGAVGRSAAQHHGLSVWGMEGAPGHQAQMMATESAELLRHGVELGAQTFADFLPELGWESTGLDRTVCHQVGAGHRDAMLRRIGIAESKDFATHEFLGNMGTVALPVSAALAAERGFLRPGHRVGFLGIGSGLNCLLLGWRW